MVGDSIHPSTGKIILLNQALFRPLRPLLAGLVSPPQLHLCHSARIITALCRYAFPT